MASRSAAPTRAVVTSAWKERWNGIKPSRKAYDELIEKEWSNVQRIMEVTQATIVRKLASYARQNQTQKALPPAE